MGVNRVKFLVGGLLIVVAIAVLMVSNSASAEYFATVDEVLTGSESMQGRTLRVSGAVIGDTIQYDPKTLELRFMVANVPGDNKEIEAQGGLAEVLHAAVMDPTRSRIEVVYNGAKPDLLKNEAQAIMTGRLGQDGVFYADELLLKCPTKYEESVPEQIGS